MPDPANQRGFIFEIIIIVIALIALEFAAGFPVTGWIDTILTSLVDAWSSTTN